MTVTGVTGKSLAAEVKRRALAMRRMSEGKGWTRPISPYSAAPPPVFSLYTGFRVRIWRKYGANLCVHTAGRDGGDGGGGGRAPVAAAAPRKGATGPAARR